MHRDVKPANILFDHEDNAFLTDFGIALEVAESGGPEAALSPGSPAYSSPEQIRRERLGPEADVFSLGVVIFECLTGSLPFGDSTSLEQLVDRQLHTPYPALAELRSDVPASVSEAVAKATAKDPADRFGSIDAFVDALGSDAETSAPLVSVADNATNPYKGLRAFDDGDVDQFFGRESLVNELVSRLAGTTIRSRGLVVVGPSGSGKSSVVRAGLTPALRGGAVPGSADWFVTTMVPGTDPFESLEAALLRIAVNPPPSLLGQLRDGKRGILRAIRRCVDSDEGRPGGDAARDLRAAAQTCRARNDRNRPSGWCRDCGAGRLRGAPSRCGQRRERADMTTAYLIALAIADALDVPVGTVKSRVFRAIRALRKELGRLGVRP